MEPDDDLERRLRQELTSARSSDRLDVDSFLASVHTGARRRRTRKTASLTVAAALVVVGAGAAVDETGVFRSPSSTVANGPSTTYQGAEATKRIPTGEASGLSTAMSAQSAPTTVKLTPQAPPPPAQVKPLSLTATGTAHQWVLGATAGKDCPGKCATVLATDKHGAHGTWVDLGQLPAPPASVDNPTPGSVSSLRVDQRPDDSGVYDAWAYGDALWTTHDSGRTWSDADSPPGKVTQLEAWGDFVYASVAQPSSEGLTAGASSPGTGVGTSESTPDTTVLYRSPTAENDWQPVDVGHPLNDVVSLATADGVVALIDSTGTSSDLYVSSDGVAWEAQQPCPEGSLPSALSTSANNAHTATSLWVTCTTATTTVVVYMDTDHWGAWVATQGTFGSGVMVAGRTLRQAFAAGAGVTGIEKISARRPPQVVDTGDVGAPLFFGFTNTSYGYLLDSSGEILSTIDGGRTWTRYPVGATGR